MTASLTMRPKGPQPVLDGLTEPDSDETAADAQSEDRARPRTAPRLESATNGFALHRSSTQAFQGENNRRTSRAASPAHLSTPRPGLLRAKSDFGPRREEVGKGDDENKTSDSGEWGIRHGFENQLVSEEYNNLLNAVRFDF
jgi:regulator-associated protein of mTOR